MTHLVRFKDRRETNLIIIHDSHTPPGSVDDVGRWSPSAHVGGLEMGLLAIGYHDIIERSGELVHCRPIEKIGTHTPGFNLDSIGICLVGGREEEGGDPVDNFTGDQRRTLLRRCHELRIRYPRVIVKGHSEVQRYRRPGMPSCPVIDMDLFREDLDLFAKGYVL